MRRMRWLTAPWLLGLVLLVGLALSGEAPAQQGGAADDRPLRRAVDARPPSLG